MRSRVVTQLFDTHAAALTLYAATWCRSPEDAVQEAFYDLSIIERWPDKPKSWLYTVTRRKALNFSRSEARQRHHAHRASQQTSGWFVAEDE